MILLLYMSFGSLFGGIISDLWDTLGTAIGTVIAQFLFGIWLSGAALVNLIESIFKKFAGIETVYIDASAKEYSGGDITNIIIQNPTIKMIFTNLITFAIIMLVFFTILQIIREQYKDKNGGNPYVILFRMVKAAVLFIFITAACMVGLKLSAEVLKALDRATGGGEAGIAGRIFSGMAANANKVLPDTDNGLFNSGARENRAQLITSVTY